MQSLALRSHESELMDKENIPFEEFHQCLQELEIINNLTLAYRPLLKWLRNILRTAGSLDAPLVILDAGCGGGDTLRKIEKNFSDWAQLELIGVDLNPWAKKSALAISNNAGHNRSHVHYETANIFLYDAGKKIDVITASLFTHHLTDKQVIDFLRWADSRAEKGWFINDLHRHSIPYYFIKITTRIFSRNRLIRNDAAVSVARSFTRADWNRLLRQAGLTGKAVVEWYFPFRFCVSCVKAEAKRHA